MSYLKPQTPIQLEDNYIYPLTTADQVILGNGNRLNSLFKKTIQENITLLASGWSKSAPYTQTIILTESTDDYKVDANVIYGGDELDIALNKAAGCITYIKKNHKKITFYCLKNKPEIDIPIEITGTCRNTIATIKDMSKLNFDIIGYKTEAEMMEDTPSENTIGVITDTPITGYRFSTTEPEGINDGEVWICTDVRSYVAFDIVDGVTVYPLYVKQMVSGVWVDKTAESWQGGEWVPWWDGYIYDTGNMFEEYTGGFASYHTATTTYPNKGSFSAGDSYITVSVPKASGIVLKTKNKIDLTRIKTIEFSITVVTASSDTSAYPPICFVDDAENHKPGTSGVAAIKKASLASGKSGVFSLDVSDLSGDYYIGVRQWNYAEGTTLKHRINKIVALA